MKKLLALAIAAAITVPMAAMADTTVYGKAHVSLDKKSGSSWDVVSHTSRIGLKGSNALDNGLTATHKFELGIDIADESNGLTDRDAWVGLKGGFGEVRIGRHTLPSDMVDDPADFMMNGHNLSNVPGRQNNAVAYIQKFGNVGFGLAYVADGSDEGVDKAADVMLNYASGPIYVGLGYLKQKGETANKRIALAYKGANYGVGYVHEDAGSGDRADTISGKYSFGKAYIAAEYGKPKTGKKSKVLELGYGLGKNTTAYIEHNDNQGDKVNRIGLVHSF